MTREEYDDLLKREQEIEDKFDELKAHASSILTALDVNHHGIDTVRVNGDTARVNYREPGCSCCPSYETREIPAAWLFADNGPDLAQADKEAKRQAEVEREKAEQQAEKTERERQDIAEFERLKAKFGATKT